MTMADGICECCNTIQKIVGVSSIPGMPISIAWYEKCLHSGAIPYEIAVFNTSMCDGLEHCSQFWKDLVQVTIAYHGKSEEQFQKDVTIAMEE